MLHRQDAMIATEWGWVQIRRQQKEQRSSLLKKDQREYRLCRFWSTSRLGGWYVYVYQKVLNDL
jgi:hypothetical protein